MFRSGRKQGETDVLTVQSDFAIPLAELTYPLDEIEAFPHT